MSETREIDGLVIEVGQLQLKDARAALVRLTRAAAPALQEFTRDGVRKLGDVDHAVVIASLGKLAETLSEADLDFFCDKFGSVSKVQIGPNMVVMTPQIANTVFGGKLLTMFKWLAFAAEVNFADFLAGLRAASPPKSPTPLAP